MVDGRMGWHDARAVSSSGEAAGAAEVRERRDVRAARGVR